ncbi:MAG: YkgJ family cysteine cluster protein [Peptococcaceae bacterium]|nr:YkgJ family cysteine cluster protein [Peptococcaceae bacterium]
MTLKMHRDLVDRLESGETAEMGMEDSFNFACDDRCMGRCCNTIKIVLDPWDVESMARHLGITGREFIENFCALEDDPQSRWPYVKLSHVENGPCVFLMEGGKCRIYPARSRNCRTYPVGRAVRFNEDGTKEEKYFLVEKQNFCLGHGSSCRRTLREWLEDSDAPAYYRRSDQYFELIHYVNTVLQAGRWLNSRIARMIMPFLYGPEVLRAKLGIPEGEAGHEEFYERRIKALKVLLTELAAGFGFGPLAKVPDGEEVEDAGIMDRVGEILLKGEEPR